MTHPRPLPPWLCEAFDELHRATERLDAAAAASDPEGILLALAERETCVAALAASVARWRAEAGPSAEPALVAEGVRVAEAAARVERRLVALREATRSALESLLVQGAAARGYAESSVPARALDCSS